MKHRSSYILAVLMMALFGCKDDPASGREGSSSDLMDPNVKPAVIYTNPPQNGVGPFSNLANGKYPASGYHFMVQFNKLMDTYKFQNDDFVTVTGFDEPVMVNVGYFSDRYTNLFRFSIRRQNSYLSPEYTIGRTYTVRIKGTATDIHDYTLGSDYLFSFTPEPVFRVVEMVPSGDVEYGTVSPNIQFNSKVDGTILPKLSITPAQSGTWYISSYDSTMVNFTPAADFTLGVPYTVSVAGTAKDAAGHTIKAATSATFTKTAAFKVTSMYYNTSQGVPVVNVYTNGTLDTVTVRSAVTVTPSFGHRLVFSGGSSSFQIFMDSLDAPDTQFTVSISAAATSTGGLAIQPYSSTLTTSNLYVEQFFPYTYEVASRYTPVELRMNFPVDTTTAAAAISISPDVPRTVTADGRYIHVKFNAPLSPRTQYSVSVSTALKSKSGKPLPYSNSYSFRTGD